jgi:hypothetical protein
MKGGLPAQQSNRSAVSAAQEKKSPSCTSAQGARLIAVCVNLAVLLYSDSIAMPSDKHTIAARWIE